MPWTITESFVVEKPMVPESHRVSQGLTESHISNHIEKNAFWVLVFQSPQDQSERDVQCNGERHRNSKDWKKCILVLRYFEVETESDHWPKTNCKQQYHHCRFHCNHVVCVLHSAGVLREFHFESKRLRESSFACGKIECCEGL